MFSQGTKKHFVQSLKILVKLNTVPKNQFFLEISSGNLNCTFDKHADFFFTKLEESTDILFLLRSHFPSEFCSGHMECSVDNRIKIYCHEFKSFFSQPQNHKGSNCCFKKKEIFLRKNVECIFDKRAGKQVNL